MSASDADARDPGPRYYGRRRGRRLRASRAALLAAPLARLDISPALAQASPGTLDPNGLFDPAPAQVWLELGFGGGEHLAEQAAAHPGIGFIGVEPYLNGLAACVQRLAAERLTNVRLLPNPAEALLTALAPASIGRLFVLFSDPWPKARHARRRLLRPETLAEFARILADGAELRLASDDPGYLRWMLTHMTAHPDFAWTARKPQDFLLRPEDWPPTRYEAKALAAGRTPVFLRFLRRARIG
ncbi:MAG: tRNA (guanosine(46)-N7)-methyltransferase TrmB [Alphaproteobacteria bacterium]|nr:tRNA (guanosine(46)-N7)-methyltransferase TrmB [Alphaproteobacteria bacterium]